MSDSEYNFNSEEYDRDEGNDDAQDEEVNVQKTNDRNAVHGEEEYENEYAASEELQSCSSTDDEMVDVPTPKYAEFNEDIDIKDPHFKIGMKFTSFKQFREVVRNYGIKHRVVMNFRPSNSKRCKAICKKGCPFYLWAAPMVKNKETIQIKSRNLKHECVRDHNIRHVNTK